MGRFRGCLWLTAGLVLAIVAGVVGFITLSKASAQQTGQTNAIPAVSVVVAVQAVPVREALRAEDLEVKDFPVNTVPEGAVGTLEDAVGMITLVGLYPGETLLQQRLLDPNIVSGDGRMALLLAEDEVLMAFPAGDLLSQTTLVKPGDHVDLLFSLEFPTDRAAAGVANAGGSSSSQDEQATFNVLENLTIAATYTANPSSRGSEGQIPEVLLLTVSPQDALVLKYLKDAGGTMDMVMRAPGAEQPFSTEPVDVDYLIQRYRIPTEVGR